MANVITALVTTMLFLTEGLPANSQQWPILAFEKGEEAHIPCVVKGDTNAYFWKKGDTYETSDHVAANVHHIPDKTDNITVLANGSLVIFKMNPIYDGRYYCRVVTENSEYHGSVTVYTKAWQSVSTLQIEECSSSDNCILHTNPHSKTSLTCTAKLVLYHVKLQWRGNTRELNNITITYTRENKDGTFNISSKLSFTYNNLSVFSCEVYDMDMKKDYVIVAIQTTVIESVVEELEEHAPDNTLLFIVIPVIICLVCLVAVLAIIAIRGRSREAKYKSSTVGKEEGVPMMDKENIVKENEELKERIKQAEVNVSELLLELSERIDRNKELSSKDKLEIFVRIRANKKSGDKSVADDILQKWKETYNLKHIFLPDEKQERIFSELEDVVQSTIDGCSACIVVFGGSTSGKKYTMKGDLSSEHDHGLIPRTLEKIFIYRERLEEKGFEIKVTASHLRTYHGKNGDNFKFTEFNADEPEGKMYDVKGLKVQMKIYQISSKKQAMELLYTDTGTSEDTTDKLTGEIFQLYVKTMMGLKEISKGQLSLAIFHGQDVTKQFVRRKGNNLVVQLLQPIITDQTYRLAIVGTMNMDTSTDSVNTMEFLKQVKDIKYPQDK